ncbi:MAG: hypothetical protein CMH28_09315 [Micavibrio sp.]|nr:hypothetical protein [Micavibrio sp.]
MSYRILFSNIGYARGIDGSLKQHITRATRHLYCSLPTQELVIGQLKEIIKTNTPDICCFVEIDKGSLLSGNYNQIEALIDHEYAFHAVSGKYGQGSLRQHIPFYKGKSNGFITKEKLPFKQINFKYGAKKLLYAVSLPDDITLLFAHFSLRYSTRQKQFEEIKRIRHQFGEKVILLADFNILKGISELDSFSEKDSFRLLNDPDQPTFIFHRRRLLLDLCLYTPALEGKLELDIIPQPFSDHAALLVEVKS